MSHNKKVEETLPFFVPLITQIDKDAVLEVLSSRWLTGGPKARKFESIFADYVGSKHAVSVNSCTAALHLSSLAIGLGPGDEVLVPVLTFAATANAVLYCGAKPVFTDIDEKTFNISPDDLSQKVTSRTKAVIVMHYGGQPCDMKDIMQIVQDNKLNLIEDCAHALGATFRGKQVGTFGVSGCFSFYPTKKITTLEGGMITTNDNALAKKARLLREHGMNKVAYERETGKTWYYDVVELGYNYRLNEVQAALGMSQLAQYEKNKEASRAKSHFLTKELKKIQGIIPPYEERDRIHVFHLYVIKVLEKEFGIDRNELFKRLSAKGIGLSLHYTPLHFLSLYKTLGYHSGDFPVAERVYKQIMSLPLFPQITDSQIEFLVRSIRENHQPK